MKKAALALCLIVLLAAFAAAAAERIPPSLWSARDVLRPINENIHGGHCRRTVRLYLSAQEYEYEGKPYNAVIRMAHLLRAGQRAPLALSLPGTGNCPGRTLDEVVEAGK